MSSSMYICSCSSASGKGGAVILLLLMYGERLALVGGILLKPCMERDRPFLIKNSVDCCSYIVFPSLDYIANERTLWTLQSLSTR